MHFLNKKNSPFVANMDFVRSYDDINCEQKKSTHSSSIECGKILVNFPEYWYNIFVTHYPLGQGCYTLFCIDVNNKQNSRTEFACQLC